MSNQHKILGMSESVVPNNMVTCSNFKHVRLIRFSHSRLPYIGKFSHGAKFHCFRGRSSNSENKNSRKFQWVEKMMMSS